MPDLKLSDLLDRAGPASTRVFRALGLFVSGVEVTQAIQWHRAADHLTDPADRGPDNGVALVAYKPAWVRVYLRSLLGATGVTGTLRLQRFANSPAWQDIALLQPRGATRPDAAWDPDYETERGSLGATLNFVIPAEHMVGRLRLVIEVRSGDRADSFTHEMWITRLQTLRLAGVMFGYDGPESDAPGAPTLQVAPPGLADLIATSAFAQNLLPVSFAVEHRVAATVTRTTPLADDDNSGCSDSWIELLGAVTAARIADGSRPGWIYYGLLPTGMPDGGTAGCGNEAAAASFTGLANTLAHELGHRLGLPHAPGCGTKNVNAAYPIHEPYDTAATPMGSIGEWGLDVNSGRVLSPRRAQDLMSYCRPRWISPYSWQRMIGAPALNPATVGAGLPWWADPREWQEIPDFPRIPVPNPPFRVLEPMVQPIRPAAVLALVGARDAAGRFAVRNVARVRLHRDEAGERTALTARLLDGRGEVLAQAAVQRLAAERACCGGCGSGGEKAGDAPPETYAFTALLPDRGIAGARLEIREGETLLWSRDAPAEGPPRIGRLSAEPESDGRMLGLRWSVAGRAEEVWLRWSRDGEDWRSLAVGLAGETARVPLAALPAGRVLVQALALDGFHTVASEPLAVEVPDRPPLVAILHPVEGQVAEPGGTLRLWGAAIGAEGERLPPERMLWLLDGREVGRGPEAWLDLPPEPGTHRLELLADDRAGPASAALGFSVALGG